MHFPHKQLQSGKTLLDVHTFLFNAVGLDLPQLVALMAG